MSSCILQGDTMIECASLWKHSFLCISVEVLISMHLCGSTHFYASLWKHSFLCISMEALISMHLCGSTHSYASPWKHSFLCISMEALILIHLHGSTHSYASSWKHSFLYISVEALILIHLRLLLRCHVILQHLLFSMELQSAEKLKSIEPVVIGSSGPLVFNYSFIFNPHSFISSSALNTFFSAFTHLMAATAHFMRFCLYHTCR